MENRKESKWGNKVQKIPKIPSSQFLLHPKVPMFQEPSPLN